jgi:hypothetical protein
VRRRSSAASEDGQGFFDYRDRDVDRYRNERLRAFVALLCHRDLMPVADDRAAAL